MKGTEWKGKERAARAGLQILRELDRTREALFTVSRLTVLRESTPACSDESDSTHPAASRSPSLFRREHAGREKRSKRSKRHFRAYLHYN